MDKMQVEAIYEHGTLKQAHELPLQEGQKILITVCPTGSAVKRLVGLVPWNGSQKDLDWRFANLSFQLTNALKYVH